MANYPQLIENLIEQLIKLPGIGRRSAERIVYYILSAQDKEVVNLSESLRQVKENIKFCKICFNLAQSDICDICQDNRRNREALCIVEESKDVIALEKSKSFFGLYHVLGGAIAPLDGKTPDDLKIKELTERIKANNIKEVIIATDADTEGETTALYLTKLIKPFGVKLTRIGMGLPIGANVEYADCTTLSKALESRREI